MSVVQREAYRTRSIRPLGLWTIDSWRLKVYGVAYDAPEPREALVAAARAAIENELAAMDGDDHYGVGWVTVHDARDGVFVLLDWWGGENMIFQRLWYGDRETPIRLTAGDLDSPVMCVWELVVAAAERQAWIDCVLANPAGADVERYLAIRVSDDY